MVIANCCIILLPCGDCFGGRKRLLSALSGAQFLPKVFCTCLATNCPTKLVKFDSPRKPTAALRVPSANPFSAPVPCGLRVQCSWPVLSGLGWDPQTPAAGTLKFLAVNSESIQLINFVRPSLQRSSGNDSNRKNGCNWFHDLLHRLRQPLACVQGQREEYPPLRLLRSRE